jgi:23S rRNA pseudouridine1911/1915/1917 synthase
MNTLTVPPEGAGRRLDAWLAAQHLELSRARIQDLIRSGHITVNGHPAKASLGLAAGMLVSLEIPPPTDSELQPEAIPINVLYEDGDLLVLNKPAGLVVHPAAGHASGTLVNALLAHCPALPGINGEKRPGIVHRLDRDTSGVMVVAKTELAMRALVDAFKARTVRKEYAALVWGVPAPASGRVETLIGRSARDRKKMSATPPRGRPAITLYETLEAFADAAWLRVRIETGRTHQIRVHMAWLGHPVIGDVEYGRQRATRLAVPLPARQMLHAERLTLVHPRTGQSLTFTAPLPEDMRLLLKALKEKP